MTEIIIRQLSIDDVHDFRTIRLSALKNSPEMFGAIYAIEIERPLSVFSEAISNNNIFAAYSQKQIIGVLIFHIDDDLGAKPQAHLYGFYVETAFRHQGIATQLLHAAIQYGQQYVDKIVLSVIAVNASAIQLYKKLGFQIDIDTIENNEIGMFFIYSRPHMTSDLHKN
ncbi:GNAT family N-acetyltransferase [Acinetobacter wuhouensis]|uniref:GNAT family N-acetyltransferase n=1 Tax=Acinetobacter wuhouensis TaxID=1879050 RepID=UPI00083A6281|nr:GNAT family N-acetyltransferase [Acinetobacter wuhouensis]AXQ23044.1 GNAT family N-acetyltransferase [Acinetobacter wuhouensis]